MPTSEASFFAGCSEVRVIAATSYAACREGRVMRVGQATAK
jgi:transcription initiation factor TFIIIB Brf1 subunit/transcription initiation factor TFIIB